MPVGKSILIGMPFLAARGAAQPLDPKSAIAIEYQDVWSGQARDRRPAPAPCIALRPVTIVRGSTGEVIRDADRRPDRLTAGSIQSAMGNILMAACTDRSLL